MVRDFRIPRRDWNHKTKPFFLTGKDDFRIPRRDWNEKQIDLAAEHIKKILEYLGGIETNKTRLWFR